MKMDPLPDLRRLLPFELLLPPRLKTQVKFILIKGNISFVKHPLLVDRGEIFWSEEIEK